MGKKQDTPEAAPAAPFNAAFAGLGAKRDALPPGAAIADKPAAKPVKESAVEKAARARPVVVRYERKGHGGKEMTRLERLELRATELEKWLKEAKQALGCGGVIDGDTILLQGDQRERAAAWLAKRNIRATIS
jgi:translation initiation factor 1